ncbi:hypothetical protein SN4111_10530 [Ligilactobacillus agilis]|nr:hypothetical protein SN4111_10530 [Ligilactobacillus agilis]
MSTTNKKMSMGQRLAYAFGAFGNDAFYGLLSGYLIVFITSHLFNTGNKALDNHMISLVTLIIKRAQTSDFNQGSSPLNYLIYFYHNSL